MEQIIVRKTYLVISPKNVIVTAALGSATALVTVAVMNAGARALLPRVKKLTEKVEAKLEETKNGDVEQPSE
jgi:hypothetical protein